LDDALACADSLTDDSLSVLLNAGMRDQQLARLPANLRANLCVHVQESVHQSIEHLHTGEKREGQ
jgi:hypothetical protein